jgi:hypothetical protein
MTIPEEDLERVRDEYTDADGALTVEDIEEDLDEAGFEGRSLEAFSGSIGGLENVAANRETLNQAQRQAIDRLGDGGAVGEVIRAEDGFTTIGSPQNVDFEIERTGSTSGDLVARNVNTGTSGKVGEVELPEPPSSA